MQQRENTMFLVGVDTAGWRRLRALPVTLLVCAGMAASVLLADGHDEQRMWQLALFAAVAPYLLLRGGLPGLPAGAQQRGLRWSLAGFFLCGAISSLLAFSLRRAVLEESMWLLLLLLSIAIAREISRDRKAGLMFVLHLCAAACAAYAFKVLLMYGAALANGLQPAVDTFSPGFSNYRFLNHAQTVALPLLALTCLLVESRWVRFCLLALTAFWWALLFLTFGRGTLVGLAAGCIVALFLRRRYAAAYCKVMLLTACGGLAIYALLFAVLPMAVGLAPAGLMGEAVRRTAADPASGRWPLCVRAFELIVANPVFGVGPMHFGHYAIDVKAGAHPHNWLLQVGSEWGIPGLLFLCGAIGFAIRALLRTAPLLADDDKANQNMLAAWIAIGAAVLVDGLVSGLFVMPMSQLWIVLYLGCAAGWTMSFQRADASGARREMRGIAGALLLLAAAGIAIGVAPELSAIVRHEPRPAAEAALYNGYYLPRIWLAGLF